MRPALAALLHVLLDRREGLSDSGRFEHDVHPLLVAAAIVADRQGVVVARLRLLLLLLKVRRYDLRNFIKKIFLTQRFSATNCRQLIFTNTVR